MSAELRAADRQRVARLLGMIGSSHDGEALNAARLANELVRGRGLTWQQVLSPPPAGHPLPELGTWRATCRACLARPDRLRPWEIGFLEDLPRFRRLSVKQRYVLCEIANRVLERAE